MCTERGLAAVKVGSDMQPSLTWHMRANGEPVCRLSSMGKGVLVDLLYANHEKSHFGPLAPEPYHAYRQIQNQPASPYSAEDERRCYSGGHSVMVTESTAG